MKKSMIALALVGVITVGGATMAFADENLGGAFRNGGTTKVQSLIEEGKTLEESREIMLQEKYERVDAAIERGTITTERGDEIKAEMTENSATCDGTGINKENKEGYGFNQGLCSGEGTGQSRGTGQGKGAGRGNCINN
ncbi:hypothetical protein GCM10008908_37190 [Clostridium subterminale]|uniref:DUF2680 domain-containing protein n=1 Tax=Clostridium subterminale TaxID=1550 RepID=A0ABN1KYJ0_CLOSU